MKRKWKKTAAAFFLAASLALPAFAADGEPSPAVGFRYARGNDIRDVGAYAHHLLGQLPSLPGQPRWFVEGGIDHWRATEARGTVNSLLDFSALAGLRWGGTWFFDAAFGGHLLSHTQIDGRHFGVAFQFGTKLATGLAFGERRQHEIDVFAEHISNGEIKKPNSGMNLLGLEYRYRLH